MSGRKVKHQIKLTLSLITILGVIAFGAVLSGCGPHGSYAWHVGTSQADKNAFFNNQSTVGLCNYWAANYPGGRPQWSTNREAVGAALARRGLNPMYCANPTQDKASISTQQARQAQARAEAAKREACNVARQAFNQCLQSPGMICISPPDGC